GGRLPGPRPDRHHPRRQRRGDRQRPEDRGPGLPGAGPEDRARLRREILVAGLGRGVHPQPAALSGTGEDPLLAPPAPPRPGPSPGRLSPTYRIEYGRAGTWESRPAACPAAAA